MKRTKHTGIGPTLSTNWQSSAEIELNDVNSCDSLAAANTLCNTRALDATRFLPLDNKMKSVIAKRVKRHFRHF